MSKSKPAKPIQVAPPRPLKPRPKLLVGLSIVYALWIGALVAMYFLTLKR